MNQLKRLSLAAEERRLLRLDHIARELVDGLFRVLGEPRLHLGPNSKAGVQKCPAASNLYNSAHIVQPPDYCRMHALVLYKITHRVIAGHGQAMLLAVTAVQDRLNFRNGC